MQMDCESTFDFPSPFLSESEPLGAIPLAHYTARDKTIMWMLELEEHFSVDVRTRHLAIFLWDRALSILEMPLDYFQLAVTICLSVSIKFEQNLNLSLADIRKLTNFLYSESFIQTFEIKILKALSWKLNYTIPFDYLSYFSHLLLEPDPSAFKLLTMNLEYCLSDSTFIGFKARNLAIACILELFSEYGFDDGREEALKLVSNEGDLEEINRICELIRKGFRDERTQIIHTKENI